MTANSHITKLNNNKRFPQIITIVHNLINKMENYQSTTFYKHHHNQHRNDTSLPYHRFATIKDFSHF